MSTRCDAECKSILLIFTYIYIYITYSYYSVDVYMASLLANGTHVHVYVYVYIGNAGISSYALPFLQLFVVSRGDPRPPVVVDDCERPGNI